MKTNLAAQLGAMIVAASLITSTSGAIVPQQGQQQSTPQSLSSSTTRRNRPRSKVPVSSLSAATHSTSGQQPAQQPQRSKAACSRRTRTRRVPRR